MNNIEDFQIVELYFARDKQAIQETADKYGKLCFQVANHVLACKEDAEECVNDTYWNAWNKIPPTRPNNLMAYICKIARNLSLKRLESAHAMKRASNAVISLSELEETLPDECIAPGIEDEEIGRLISSFLRNEKEEARNVFLRKYWFFDSVSDIAARYSFSESKVKSMLFHTRSRLRQYLKKEGIAI